jgi:hypothetical protein
LKKAGIGSLRGRRVEMDAKLFLQVCRRALKESEIRARQRVLDYRLSKDVALEMESQTEYDECKEAIDLIDAQ